ncbi:hypothetical protein MTP09_07415 [Chryseobacterium suipulveris]|uniref:Uncharacterized protein n=1 Tax=Chryseobacterium suipulveris TaxID=2929800 RepID=A0ABY4BKQ0_9FLAO|nr:hypothetical protein [Chryseobacterium suipulveris]UOE39754.1 hypothetical protein MTP09_07415 [Chryseobacterium suipulveris]
MRKTKFSSPPLEGCQQLVADGVVQEPGICFRLILLVSALAALATSLWGTAAIRASYDSGFLSKAD